ncbi:CRISPR-associated protein Cas4 [Methylacidiphilum caldifontis]|uniref:CRISPR-associated exonuclease Cas4 n=1 Tax=Methylacidiphilum caldifontis TaxID=2795386 RepID=A0A4Y8PAC7_9BACT|nr:CRISPR-associated protein Cas4 [Methylacidiphilum caldifontis]TFE67811.1 CRISPR-associated protein Cas4 [Methylacidiphilum caldifontis]
MINDSISNDRRSYNEEATTNVYVSISALNHYEYCPTRCYWIYVAGEFLDNEYTIEGEIIHENVHKTMKTTRGDLVQLRKVLMYSRKYALIGFADLIEENSGDIYPVEYKRGRRGDWKNDKLQLCAQALCLEEMLDENFVRPSSLDKKSLRANDKRPATKIQKGFIYYASTARRVEVSLDEELRKYTIETIERVRQLISDVVKTPAIYKNKCRRCSLYPVCLPKEEKKTKKFKLDFC